MAWSKQIESSRIVPFPSFHPLSPEAIEQIDMIAGEGFKGIKLHPYYQDFFLDAPMMIPLYERMASRRLILVSHTGFDIAFPRIRKADADRIVRVMAAVPSLKLVTTHMGSWEDWDRVGAVLAGKPVYMEISYSLGQMPDDKARDLLLKHPVDRVLFGTDSPWQDQSETIRMLKSLRLGSERESAIFHGNASCLLEL
ncbi:MAG: amidohydrolase [Verrucomicrobia bacterium]|nr:amidohydrolase [Verrucomicrobiota bacterium]